MSSNKLEDIVRRLEAVAERLEGLDATSTARQGSKGGPAGTAPQPAATSASQQPAAPAAAPLSASEAAHVLQELQLYLDRCVPALESANMQLAQEFQAGTPIFVRALQGMAMLVMHASTQAKPEGQALQDFLVPLAEPLEELSKLEQGRPTKAVNHLKALLESAQALTWVVWDATPPPAAMFLEYSSGAELYTNKVIMEYRDSAPEHKLWCHALKTAMKDLHALIEKYFRNGVQWGAIPDTIPAFARSASVRPVEPGSGVGLPPLQPPTKADPSTGAPTKGPPPAPPPPAPGTFFEQQKKKEGSQPQSGDSRSQLMAALNKGSNVTSGLKKVTDDMKTKNRTDRSGKVTATSDSSARERDKEPGTKGAASSSKPARKALEDKRWMIEYQVDVSDPLQLQAGELKRDQAVYISHCRNCVVQVHDKVNTIMLDNCTKVGLVFDAVVSAIEVVNCKSIQFQAQNAAPTINIDKTDGAQVFVSEKVAAATAITTSKCSAVNVTVLKGDEDEEPQECPVPEQFVSTFVDGKMETKPLIHKG